MFQSNVFNLNFKNAVAYLTFKDLEKYDFINHAFSTRLGGVSKNENFSMNLSFKSEKSRNNVLENYKIFCEATNFDYESLVASSQEHTTNIRQVYEKDKGIGILKKQDLQAIDGLITNVIGITLATYFADCVPLFFIDTKLRVIGLAHAGWKGTLNLMAEKMITNMVKNYNCNTQNIVVAIGPCISSCCYEVGEDLIKNFEKCFPQSDSKNFLTKNNKGNYFLDLKEVNKVTLKNMGIPNKNIIVSDICTSCNKDILFSHRATNGKRGTMAAMLCLK